MDPRVAGAQRRGHNGGAGRRPGLTAPALPDALGVFRHVADGVMALDAEGTFVFWNDAAEAILGYTASDVLGRPCWEVLDGRTEQGNLSCHPHCHVLAMAARHEPVRTYDFLTRAKDGTPRWVNISTIQIPAAGGYLIVRPFRDVTRQHQLTEALFERLGGAQAHPAHKTTRMATPLTLREQEVLHLLAQGEAVGAIAERLGIHAATARNHIQNILSKLGAHSRLEAVAIASRAGIV